MMMAINRSQDFVKSSLNLALVPTITPFPISEALSFACDCVDMTTQQSVKGTTTQPYLRRARCLFDWAIVIFESHRCFI